MFHGDDIPAYPGSRLVAVILALPGVFLIVAGAIALLDDLAKPDQSSAVIGYVAAAVIATGIALLGASVLIFLVVDIAQATKRSQNALESLALTQKAQIAGADAATLRDLAETR